MKLICSFTLFVVSAVQAAHWQESLSGQLTQLSVASGQPACPELAGPASYSGIRTGGSQLTRLAFDEGGLHLWQADASSTEQVIVRGTDPDSPEVVSHWGWQPLSQSTGSYQVFWHEPATQQLRAVAVKAAPFTWQPLWSASAQVLPAQLPALLRPQRLADENGADWLLLPGNSSVPVQLFNSQTGVPRLLPLPAISGNFALQPLTQDLNGDQAAERLYLLSSDGQLLQVDYQVKAGWQSRVVADLSGSDLIFDVSLQRFAGRWRHQDGHWLQGDVFVMIGRKQQQYQLMAVLRPDGFADMVRFDDLSALPSLGADAVQAADATQKDSPGAAAGASGHGWSVALAARPVTAAKLLAGVLYLPMTDQQSCRYPGYNQLAALQLYSGAAVYQQSQWQLAASLTEPLRLEQSSETGFNLVAGAALLLTELRTLSAACTDCTELLGPQHLQGRQPLALFQTEQVY